MSHLFLWWVHRFFLILSSQITHLQEYKTTVTTASGNRYTVLMSVAIVEEWELI
jgi:hypothetical protein